MAQQITIQDISKTYGPVTALDSVDLEVDGGEFISLLGPSGSGKTTLLMIIAGFVQPDHGSIKFDGREIVIMPPHKRDIGLVFQSYALFPHMTVAGNVEFPLRYRDISRDEARRKVASALDLVRLSGLENRRIDELSGGQKQRVALARALVFNPKILLMDEPLSALDKNLRERMQIELKHLQKQLGTTTIYVTHDQHEALTMSDRVAVMNNGAIQQVGTPADIYERPANRFVAGFVGDSQFVNVTRAGDASVRLGQTELRLGRPADFHGEQGLLLLRPEKVELLTTPGSSELNALQGKTKEIIYKGDSVLIAVVLATGEEVLVRRGTNESTRRMLPRAGDDVWLGIHPMDTVVVTA